MVEMVRNGIGRLRDVFRPDRLNPTPGGDQPTIALLGNLSVSGGESPGVPGVRLPRPRELEHALYQVTLPAGTSLPADVEYTSLIVQVVSGQVRITSPSTSITRTLAPQTRRLSPSASSITPTDRLVLATESLAPGFVLGPGESTLSQEEAIGIANDGPAAATLIVSAVLGPDEMADPLCFICPRGRISS
jgi:hypothetical protein